VSIVACAVGPVVEAAAISDHRVGSYNRRQRGAGAAALRAAPGTRNSRLPRLNTRLESHSTTWSPRLVTSRRAWTLTAWQLWGRTIVRAHNRTSSTSGCTAQPQSSWLLSSLHSFSSRDGASHFTCISSSSPRVTALFSATGAHLVAASSSLHLVSSLPLIFVDSSSCLIFVTSSSPPPLSGSSLLLSASSSLSLRFYSILGVSPLPARRRSSLQRSPALHLRCYCAASSRDGAPRVFSHSAASLSSPISGSSPPRDGAHLFSAAALCGVVLSYDLTLTRATALIFARRRSSVSFFRLSGFSLVSPQRLFSSARRRSSLQRGGALWGRTIVRPHTHARDGAHLRATALIFARRRSSSRDGAHLISAQRFSVTTLIFDHLRVIFLFSLLLPLSSSSLLFYDAFASLPSSLSSSRWVLDSRFEIRPSTALGLGITLPPRFLRASSHRYLVGLISST